MLVFALRHPICLTLKVLNSGLNIDAERNGSNVSLQDNPVIRAALISFPSVSESVRWQ